MINPLTSQVNLNGTEIIFELEKDSSYEEILYSSIFHNINQFFSKKSEALNSIESSQSRTFELRETPLLKSLQKYISREHQENLTILTKKLAKELVIELKFFSINDSESSSAEKKIWKMPEEYSFRILGEVLQDIYVEYNDYPNILAGICKGLSQFDLDEVTPWGQTLLAGMLNHKSEIVKEYAVALVESWADVSLLPILKNLDCHAVWLKEYISEVISYLEECNVLSEKTV